MARFYGTVQGGRGEASRLGHSTSGLGVSAKSWNGCIGVRLYDEKGVDHCYIDVEEHNGSRRKILYRGPIADLVNGDIRLMRTILTLEPANQE